MNFKKYHVSRNLLNRATDILGYRLGQDGAPFPDSAYEVSEFIAITPNTYISRSENFTTNRPLCEYDAEKNHIKRTTSGSSVLLTNNTYYVRTAVEQTDIDVMLNTGSTALPYEPYGDTWHDTPHYIHNTATDTITILPAVIYADGNTATVGLKGNTVQSGTPTPDNPIMPQSCGERTGNLFDSNPYKIGYAISSLGTETQNSEFNIYTAKVSAGTQYCLSFVCPESARYRMVRIHEYSGGIWQSQLIAQNCELFPLSFTTSDNIDEVRISIINTTSNHMLNTGSTPLPYEPYGYKIPISSAWQTTPIYLGEVETTRRIKKYEITGNERWVKEPLGDTPNRYHGNDILTDCGNNMQGFCSHYIYAVANNYGNIFIASNKKDIFVLDSDVTSAQALSEYFAQQYAAGTPVTVWYVLATETTGMVNEPLMKIGNYADTVSGITIPTITGKDTFDVETTLKPSEASLSYTGWHDATVGEWDGSQWNQ